MFPFGKCIGLTYWEAFNSSTGLVQNIEGEAEFKYSVLSTRVTVE